jgi:hypothetical protein
MVDPSTDDFQKDIMVRREVVSRSEPATTAPNRSWLTIEPERRIGWWVWNEIVVNFAIMEDTKS